MTYTLQLIAKDDNTILAEYKLETAQEADNAWNQHIQFSSVLSGYNYVRLSNTENSMIFDTRNII